MIILYICVLLLYIGIAEKVLLLYVGISEKKTNICVLLLYIGIDEGTIIVSHFESRVCDMQAQ